ncbi:acyl-coenzyme A thioesterase 8-like [Amphiura filiformis]|uniref:acyl-coenzyme A thioesterase 8-like n=1 Tax=Amphiura filiformis TaxID=82378 RepID=UPI003B212485
MSDQTIPGSDVGETGTANGSQLRSVLVDTILNLEELEPGLYRAIHHWKTLTGRLYGGQVVGQALVAASHTVSPQLHVHSLHCYFLKFGTRKHPVLYKVHNVRDGKSFSTRSVQASQDGVAIFTMMASFHITEESPFQHQYSMPHVPKPHELKSDRELVDTYVKHAPISSQMKAMVEKQLTREIDVEFRRIDPMRLFMRSPTEPQMRIWVKAKDKIGEDMRMHQCVAAYLSDYFLAMSQTLPFRHIKLGQIASLDHSIWFHCPFRTDEWMLYECESPRTGAARGISLGRLWQEDGKLVATVAQEAVLRPQL